MQNGYKMQVQIIQKHNNSNYRQNFTAVKYPEDKKLLYSCLGKEVADKFIELKPEIEKLSDELDVDFEFALGFGCFNMYAGKLLKKPWQKESTEVAQYIHPNKPVRWEYSTYRNFGVYNQAKDIPDTIIDRLTRLALCYHRKLELLQKK